jgi:hypothetical protein
MTERTMPEGLSDERSLLDGWLDYYRATLLAKCDGLTGQQLITRSCEPSPMSLIGLVRHMTEMERIYGHRLISRLGNQLAVLHRRERGRRLHGRHRRRGRRGPGDIPRALRSDRADHGGSPTRRHLRHEELVHAALVLPVPDQGIRPASGPCRSAARTHRRGDRRIRLLWMRSGRMTSSVSSLRERGRVIRDRARSVKPDCGVYGAVREWP